MTKRNLITGAVWGTVITLVVVIVFIITSAAYQSYTENETVVTRVTDKENVCETTENGSSCQYLIFTEAGTFKLTDQLFLGFTRFDSSDVYGRIEPGETYEIVSVGWRVPVLSWYPNIKEITEVSQ